MSGGPAVAGGPARATELKEIALRRSDLPRWSDVLARAGVERLDRSPFGCGLPSAAFSDTCRLAAWQHALDALRALPTIERLAAVNRAVNALPYVSDLRNWGVADRWATPSEMITRGGDCEDYALTKYFALRDLGLAEAAMQVAIVWDVQDGEQHAILFVENEGARWILDNKAADLVPAASAGRYRVIYALNIRGASFSPTARRARRGEAPRLSADGRSLIFRMRPLRRAPALPAGELARRGPAPTMTGPVAAQALARALHRAHAPLLPDTLPADYAADGLTGAAVPIG